MQHSVVAAKMAFVGTPPALAIGIAARIEERAFCVVFEDDLERCWPGNKMPQTKRNREIQNFANLTVGPLQF